MRYNQCLIASNKNGDINAIKIFPWPDYQDRASLEGYIMTYGATFSSVHRLTSEGIKAQIMYDFLILVKAGAFPQKIHEAFLEIDEYSEMCPNGPPKMSKVMKMAKLTWYGHYKKLYKKGVGERHAVSKRK